MSYDFKNARFIHLGERLVEIPRRMNPETGMIVPVYLSVSRSFQEELLIERVDDHYTHAANHEYWRSITWEG